jgi:hypothetical protein
VTDAETRKPGDDYVLYDGACPACSRYVAATGLAGCGDRIALIDARHAPALVAEHAAARPHIDDGMVVRSAAKCTTAPTPPASSPRSGRRRRGPKPCALDFVEKAPWS